MTNDLRDETQLAIKSDCVLQCEVNNQCYIWPNACCLVEIKYLCPEIKDLVDQYNDDDGKIMKIPKTKTGQQVRTNLVKRCGDSNHGNRLITNGGQMMEWQEFLLLRNLAFICCLFCCQILPPGVYFIFRMLATMALASCFILLDAQTIQMCTSENGIGKKERLKLLYLTAQAVISIHSAGNIIQREETIKEESLKDQFLVEEKRGHTGSYGKQILYKTLAQVATNTVFVTRKNTKYRTLLVSFKNNESFIQAVISPSVGAVMDYITEMQGQVITITITIIPPII